MHKDQKNIWPQGLLEHLTALLKEKLLPLGLCWGLLSVLSAPCFAQSVPAMEAQYKKTTDRQTRMTLAYQIADKSLGSNPKKASDYATLAYNLATDLSDNDMLAKSSWINAQGFLKSRDVSGARIRFKRCAEHAFDANNVDLAVKCYDQLEDLAKRDRNYVDAYNLSQELVGILRSRGGSGGVSNKNADIAAQRNRLLRDKEQLEKDKQQLHDEIARLTSERDQLSSEKSQYKEKEKQLVQEKEQVKQQVSAKDKEIESIALEKDNFAKLSDRKTHLLKALTNAKMLDSIVLHQELQEKENMLMKTQLQVERSGNQRNLMLIVSGVVLLLAGLFYKRFLDNKKAKKVLEDKNRIIETERERSDELLLNILPAPIAQELRENGRAKARKYENATVMFTDFINFTQLSELLTPEQLVEELDSCFKAFDNIISHYKIEKIKTIGDAYMCATGLIENNQSPPTNLIKAALEMQEFLQEHKAEKKRRGEPYFEARMGIHSGPVVAGVVGVNKFAYDIWGDTVNIAARMEANCEPGRINVSDATYWQIKYDFRCNYRGKIAAKNKGEIDMYYVEASI